MIAPRLVPPVAGRSEPAPDAAQARVLDLVAARRHVVAVGAPGTGKTSLVVMTAAQEAARIPLDRILVLAATRTAASDLRDRISLAVAKPSSSPVARTAPAAAFAVLAAQAMANGDGRPALISGAEQDAVLKELLEGHLNGRVAPIDWGLEIPQRATVLPAFREELRNLLMRAAEAGLGPAELDRLGRHQRRPEWVAAAQLYEEYENVMALRSHVGDQGARYDPATIVSRAATVLDSWETESAGPVPHWDLIIIDDYHEATAATSAFIDACVRRGAVLLATGNADEAVQGYRGGQASSLGDAIARYGAQRIELDNSHRLGGSLLAVTSHVCQRIGVKGQSTARAALGSSLGHAPQAETHLGDMPDEAAPGADAVVSIVAATERGRNRAIASELRQARRAFGEQPVPWSSMAVVARSRHLLRQIRSDLVAAGLPCESLGEGVALHQEPAVAPLLAIVKIATGGELDRDNAVDIITSKHVGLDSLGVRRLRRDLLREERAGGGSRDSESLMIEALVNPGSLATLDGAHIDAVRRAASAIAAARAAADAPGANPASVLWAAWEALGVAQSWRAGALAGSSRDDADLDAVIALMRAAQDFAVKLPHVRIGAFLDSLEAQDFAADSLGARARVADAVSFHTPASAAGTEYDVVVVAGLEEGVWPNTTLRDSLLGAQRLAELVAEGLAPGEAGLAALADVRAARAAVLDDETRALAVAVSRARQRLVIASVDDGQSRPSRYVGLIEAAADVPRRAAESSRMPSDLRTAIASLRAEAERRTRHGAPDQDLDPYASMLASAAHHGVEGADPLGWHGVATPSTTEPLWPLDAPVRVSPSKVESVESCALRWAFESHGGALEPSQAQEVGTLIHELAQRHPHGGAAQIRADFDELWAERGPTTTWADRQAYAEASAKVDRLIAYLASRADVAVLTEQAFKVAVDDAILAGSADRIEMRDGGGYVVDIKTGSTMPSNQEALTNAQLEMYQLAVALGAVEGIQEAVGAELAFVSSGTAGAVRAQGPVDKEAALARLRDVVSVMRGDTFEAVVNERCGTCPVRRACPAHAEGRQVTEQ